MSSRAILLLFSLCIFALSQAGVLVRMAATTPDVIGFWRMAFATPLLLVAWRLQPDRQPLFCQPRAVWIKLLICSIFLYLHWRVWFMAIAKTSVANATVCFALTPLLSALGTLVFFKEKVSSRLWVAIAMGLVGVIIMVGDRMHSGTHEGDILGLIATTAFTAYILLGKSIRQSMSNLNFTLLAYGLVGIYFAASLSFEGPSFYNYSTSTWIVLVALAVGPTLFGHAVFTYCLNFLDVNFMTCATLFEPIFAAWAAAYFFKEPLRSSTLLAFLLISAGVLMVYRPNIKSLINLK